MKNFTVVAIGKSGHQHSTHNDAKRAREIFNVCLQPELEFFAVALYHGIDLADFIMRPAPFIPPRTPQ